MCHSASLAWSRSSAELGLLSARISVSCYLTFAHFMCVLLSVHAGLFDKPILFYISSVTSRPFKKLQQVLDENNCDDIVVEEGFAQVLFSLLRALLTIACSCDWCSVDWCSDWCSVDWCSDWCSVDWCSVGWCSVDWCSDWCFVGWCSVVGALYVSCLSCA